MSLPMQSWLVYALPVMVAVAALEGLYISKIRRRPYDWRENATSLAVAIGRRLAGLLPIGFTVPLFAWLWNHRLFTIPLDSAGAVALLFIGQELCYYWLHRCDHAVRWLWASHAVHHSPQQFTLASAYRLAWTDQISGAALFFAPLVVLGFRPEAVLAAAAANLVYQFWLHTELVPKLGALEWVLNTPSHHRVHHAMNPEYLDRNFGGVLIVFDRLFGTFAEERADIPCRYGVIGMPQSYNPVTIACREWVALARDFASTRSLRNGLGYLLKAPGWAPKDDAAPLSRVAEARAR
ncbi:MAG TPA: sterol desaturase family protein [Alphaproteobacteria bacterium]|nr:sterol desaturase family protein [Alphaproteobacteria bacterium]